MRLNRGWSLGAGGIGILGGALACGGGGVGAPEIAPETQDPVWKMIGEEKFKEAEDVLKDRLAEAPEDVLNLKLMGDLNWIRGQVFPRAWVDNRKRAKNRYLKAVALAPQDCGLWARLAALGISGAGREDLELSVGELGALPLDKGWEHCPGGAVLALEELKHPGDGSSALERPELAEPWKKTLTKAPEWAWTTRYEPPPAAEGGWVVLLDGSVTAQPVGPGGPRTIEPPAKFQIRGVDGSNVRFLDYGFTGTTKHRGWISASACPGSSWNFKEDERKALGHCQGGAARPNFPVYAAEILQVAASETHWSEPTIDKARVPMDSVIRPVCQDSGIGKLLVDDATCEVVYEKAVAVTRSLPVSAVRVAVDEDHALRILTAKKMDGLLGGDVASHVSIGDVAPGMSYTLFALTQPNLQGCSKRALYQKAKLVNGQVELTCSLGGWDYVFENFDLRDLKRARK